MASPTKKSTLVLLRRSPYGSALSRSALDTALAMAAFDQPVALLLMGAAVVQLLPDQDAAAIGRKNHARALDALPLYEIERVYVEAEALSDFAITEAEIPTYAQAVDARAIRSLLCAHDHLLEF